jgi:hypothetical protein
MKRRTRVYVAGPITSSGNLLHNVRNALNAGTALLQRGYAPYVPHLTCYWEIFAQENFTYEDWIQLDLAYLQTCDALVRLPGVSSGADREVEVATARRIPVYFSLDTVIACEPAEREE